MSPHGSATAGVPTFIPPTDSNQNSLLDLLQKDNASPNISAAVPPPGISPHNIRAPSAVASIRSSTKNDDDLDGHERILYQAPDASQKPLRSSAPIGSERARTPGAATSPHNKRKMPQQLFQDESEDYGEQGTESKTDMAMKLLPQGLLTSDLMSMQAGGLGGLPQPHFASGFANPADFPYRKDPEVRTRLLVAAHCVLINVFYDSQIPLFLEVLAGARYGTPPLNPCPLP